MPRLPIPGSDNGQWGNILNDFLSIAHNSDGTINDSRLDTAEQTANKNQANGYAGLDSVAGLSVTSRAVRVGPVNYDYSASIAGGGSNSAYVVVDKSNTASDASVLIRDQGAARAEIGLAGDNDLHFKTITGVSGSEVFTDRLLIQADGLSWFVGALGVGTIPVERLHISGIDAGARILAKIENMNTSGGSQSTAIHFSSDDLDWSVGVDAGLNGGNNFFIRDESATYTPRIFIDPVGNVGIGTEDPDYRLAIDGGIAILDNNSGLHISEGLNSTIGSVTLVGGTAVATTTHVTADSRIFLTIQSPGGTVGSVYVSSRVPGASFTISSTSGTDTSTVAWVIIEPILPF